ncbi:MAG: hypothetical protein JWM64_2039 [Frankiales bacterium]|nr:hypothetical protein [Frankiales bacterium]
MRWWPLRRRESGRHGLGAAVTSIPSGPLVVPVAIPLPAVDPSPAVDPEVAAALARAQAEAALLPSLPLDEVARVLGVPAPGAAVAAPAAPVAPPVSVAPSAASVTVVPQPVVPSPFLDLPLASPAQAADPVAPVVHVPGQAPSSRVQLGFRDGSTSAVDDVDQARALEDLARALTSSG